MLTGKNDTILNSLSKMVQLSLPKCGRNVFGISGNEELDAVFNGFKSTVLQSLYVLFKYVRSRSEKNEGKGGEGWKAGIRRKGRDWAWREGVMEGLTVIVKAPMFGRSEILRKFLTWRSGSQMGKRRTCST